MKNVTRARALRNILAVFLVACPVQASPIRFADALDIALRHAPAPLIDESSSAHFCPVPLQDFAALAAQLDSASEIGLPGTGPNLFPATASTDSFLLASRHDLVLCTALVYSSLEDIQKRKELMRKQEESVTRLMNIETRRVSAEVDHPLLLAEAKMLRAKTRMASTALDASEQAMRTALASLLESPTNLPSVIEDSLPALPPELPAGHKSNRVLRRLLAFRDIVQLEYISAFMNRRKAAHDVAMARATIGVFVAAQVGEMMKLSALSQFNNEVRLAKIQALGADLETWADGKPLAEAAPPGASGAYEIASTAPAPSPQPLAILLVPAIKDLPIGSSQQYSVVATDADGHAQDVTAEATWICSTDTKAVLSTTGLVTALSQGQLTIRAEYRGLTSSRALSVSTQASDEGVTF